MTPIKLVVKLMQLIEYPNTHAVVLQLIINIRGICHKIESFKFEA